jgi:hypothetical protein
MSNTGNSSSWDGLSICETHHFAARPMAVRQPPRHVMGIAALYPSYELIYCSSLHENVRLRNCSLAGRGLLESKNHLSSKKLLIFVAILSRCSSRITGDARVNLLIDAALTSTSKIDPVQMASA